MRVVVDFDRCQSNAVCMDVAPEIFEVRDDNFLYILDEKPSEAMRPKLEEAVRRCPTQAISIAEDLPLARPGGGGRRVAGRPLGPADTA
jgi:ferredoxin